MCIISWEAQLYYEIYIYVQLNSRVCVYVRLYTLLYHAKLKTFLQRGIQKILNNNTTLVQHSIIKCDCKLFYDGKVNFAVVHKSKTWSNPKF